MGFATPSLKICEPTSFGLPELLLFYCWTSFTITIAVRVTERQWSGTNCLPRIFASLGERLRGNRTRGNRPKF